MFTCGDCWTECEGREKHPNAQACDDFDSKEEEVAAGEQPSEIEVLRAEVAPLFDRVAALEHTINTIIAAFSRIGGGPVE